MKYAPTEEERAGFFAKFSIQDKSFDTKDGGLYYNTTLKTLEMELPCAMGSADDWSSTTGLSAIMTL